jgi:hypothetical protein
LNERRRSTLTLAALVVANLVPVFGVLQLDWDVGAIVILYWCENLVIGGFTVIKLLMAAGVRALFNVLFFMVHYGGFCGVHGFFVLELTGFAGDGPDAMTALQSDTWPGPLVFPQLLLEVTRSVMAAAPPALFYGVAALLLSHGISFALNYIGGREHVGQKTGQIMTAPYGRILVLQIAIIAGGFLVSSLGSPLGLLLALVALKIGMDIMLHRRSHRRTARPAAATHSAAPPPRHDTGTGEN